MGCSFKGLIYYLIVATQLNSNISVCAVMWMLGNEPERLKMHRWFPQEGRQPRSLASARPKATSKMLRALEEDLRCLRLRSCCTWMHELCG